MLKNNYMQRIFAIAFCHICREYATCINERTASLDAERMANKHAGINHEYNRKGIGWTNVEKEMAEIRRKSGYKETYL